MRQRLGIAAALLQPRELLILDEPTNGLDPQGTREVRALITELAAGGVTVLLSTHLLSEVEQICTHVGVMHVGKLVAQSSADATCGPQSAPRIRVQTDRPDLTRPPACARLGLTDIVDAARRRDHGAARVRRIRRDVLAALVRADGVRVRAFGPVPVNLEDVFVTLTGEGFGVSG